MAHDTAHATQRTEQAHRGTGAKWPRTPHTRAHVGRPRDRKEPTTHGGRTHLGDPADPPGHQQGQYPKATGLSAPGCIGDHGKRDPEPWKQPVNGKPAHNQGKGRLPSRESPQLKPQG